MNIPIIDGHNDTLSTFIRLNRKAKLFFERSGENCIDYPRMKQANFIGGMFSVFIPPHPDSSDNKQTDRLTLTERGYEMVMDKPIDPNYAKEYTDRGFAIAKEIESMSNNTVKIIRTSSEIEQNIKSDIVSIILHIEGAEAINSDLSNLEDYYQQGLRAIGITWGRPNVFGIGVPFRFPATPDIGDGLTTDGKELIKVCNELGIIIDLAHINLRGFIDVAKISSQSLVVSHAGVYSLCNSSRNVMDEQLKLIKESNGIIGIFFEPGNLRVDGNHFTKEKTSFELIVNHIDYVVQNYGVDYVGFGSDFDGAQLPEGIKDISDVHKIIDNLRNRGYNQESLEKIAYKNWLRVFRDSLPN